MESWWVCEPDEAFSHPYTALVRATRAGDTSTVASLITTSQLNPARPLPSTTNPLAVEACLNREQDILEMLLEANPEEALRAVDVSRAASLLHLAAFQGDSGIATMLLQHNSDLLRAVDVEGLTSLHYAALSGRRAISAMLLGAGAEINACSPASQVTPLHLAASSGHDHCVECLLIHHADVNVADVEGRTPLIAAAAAGHGQIVQRLLRAGANPTAMDELRRTALHWAAHTGDLQAAQALLQAANNALVDVADAEQETALLVASRRGVDPLVELLLAHRAAVEAANVHGITPLMAAAFFGHQSVVSRLATAGANVSTTQPSTRRTALHLAALGGQPEVVRVLVSYGAPVNAQDADGKTPRDLAADSDIDVAALLGQQ